MAEMSPADVPQDLLDAAMDAPWDLSFPDETARAILAAVLPLHEQELRAERDAAIARAEQAEAEVARLRGESEQFRKEVAVDELALLHRLDRYVDENRALTTRTEQAEAALAELRERLGQPMAQRGLRYGSADPLPIPDDQVTFYLDQGHVGLVERDVWHGQWRPVATWRTALERAADEQRGGGNDE